MSTNHIHHGGPVTIYSSTTGDGEWYAVHNNIRNLTFQAVVTGSSVGAAIANAFAIEASNDGSNAILLDTILFSSTGSLTSPQSDGTSIDAHYRYIRVSTGAGTTQSTSQTIAVTATPHLIK